MKVLTCENPVDSGEWNLTERTVILIGVGKVWLRLENRKTRKESKQKKKTKEK